MLVKPVSSGLAVFGLSAKALGRVTNSVAATAILRKRMNDGM